MSTDKAMVTPQMILDTAAWSQSEQDLRDTLRMAAEALSAALAHPPAKREAGETAAPDTPPPQSHLRVGEFIDLPASSVVPKWLEDYDGEVTFMTDVIVLRREDGFEVRAKNPNHIDAIMYADKCSFINGQSGGVTLYWPSMLDMQIQDLRAENERLKAVAMLGYSEHSGVAQMIQDRLGSAFDGEATFSSEEVDQILAALSAPAPVSRERVSDTPSAALEASHE